MSTPTNTVTMYCSTTLFGLRGVHHGAERLRHDPRKLLVTLRDRRRRVEDLLPDRLRVAARSDVREIGRDHLTLPIELVAGEAPGGLDDGFRVGATAGEGCSPRPTPTRRGRWGGWGGRRDVRRAHVHRAALRFEECNHGPDLRGRELTGHHGHDRLVAGDDVRGRVVERLVQILLARLAGLPLAAPSTDRSLALLIGEEVRRPLPQPVAGGAAADSGVDLLPRGDELLRRDVGAQRERLRHFRLHLRDLVGDEGIERQRPEDDPDDLRVSGPHAGLPSRLRPTRRTWTSPRARPARTRTPRARGRSARTG